MVPRKWCPSRARGILAEARPGNKGAPATISGMQGTRGPAVVALSRGYGCGDASLHHNPTRKRRMAGPLGARRKGKERFPHGSRGCVRGCVRACVRVCWFCHSVSRNCIQSLLSVSVHCSSHGALNRNQVHLAVATSLADAVAAVAVSSAAAVAVAFSCRRRIRSSSRTHPCAGRSSRWWPSGS